MQVIVEQFGAGKFICMNIIGMLDVLNVEKYYLNGNDESISQNGIFGDMYYGRLK